MSLEATDIAAAAVATEPRVTLRSMEEYIAGITYITGTQLWEASSPTTPAHPDLAVLTICMVTFRNGFTVLGKSAPAIAANFSADLGRSIAYEDAIRQAWPLFGFALREATQPHPHHSYL